MIHHSGPVHIRVYGEPQPFPKKDVAVVQRPGMKPRLVPVDHDYQIRTDPDTGKTKKYNRGYKRIWMKVVAVTVNRYLVDHDLEPFPRNHALAMGCLFFLTKSKSCKLTLPSQKPDEDNLLYAVRNALESTTNSKGPGIYPTGALYHADSQIVWILKPQGKVWATEQHKPGVLITVQDAYQLRDEWEPWQPPKQTALM